MEPRIAPVENLAELDPDARAMLEGMARNGEILNIFRTLIRHPKLFERWLVFATHILRQTSIPPRDRELLILRTAHRCGSIYEWGQHAKIALRSGVKEQEVGRVADGPTADGWAGFDAALLRAADELIDQHRLSQETWQALATTYNVEQMMDAIFTVGNYAMLAGALNSFGVPLDEEVADR